MTIKSTRFELYRYQLLPRDRYFQTDLLGDKTVEDVLARKNAIFSAALDSIKRFSSSRTELATELLWNRDDFYLYRVAADRSITRETREFKKETLDNWPSILIAIWNNPSRQLVAIQKRTSAFQHSDSVIKVISDTLAPYLFKAQLTAVWEPLFEKAAFWELIAKYSAKIQEVEFEIVTPNMANISKVLPDNLRDFAKHTNAIKSRIAIHADPSSSLKVEEENKTIGALVDYAAEGGGNVSVKVSGLKKRLHTSRTVKEVEVTELELEGEPEHVAKMLKEILQ